jgi:hypothetical protein
VFSLTSEDCTPSLWAGGGEVAEQQVGGESDFFF